MLRKRITLSLLLPLLAAISANSVAATNYSVSTAPASWIDPSSHTLVTWSAGSACSGGSYNGFSPDDDITAQIPLGFTFTYGSTDYTSVQIMSNGRVQFGNGWCDYGAPYYTPPDNNLNNTMYVLSMDLDPSDYPGNPNPDCEPTGGQPCGVYFASLGAAPNRYFVVTWRNVPEYNRNNSFYNAQVIIHEDGRFVFQYDTYNRRANDGDPGIGWQLDSSTSYAHDFNPGSTNGNLDNAVGQALTFSPTDLAGFVISVPQYASQCALTQVGITALDSNGNVYTQYTGTLELYAVRQNNNNFDGTWSNGDGAGTFTSGGVDSGTAVYQFVSADNGTITVNFGNDDNQDMYFAVRDRGTGIWSPVEALIFLRSVFELTPVNSVSPVNTLVAGRPHQITVTSLERQGGSCVVETSYDGVKDLQAWITRDVADPGGIAPTVGFSSPLPSSNPNLGNAENISLNFNNGVATLVLQSSDVGKYTLSLNDTDENQGHIGATPTLTVRPFGYSFMAPAFNAGATGAIASAAGVPFTFTINGVLWETVDDADNDGVPDGHADTNPANDADLSNNGNTPSFAWDTSLQAVAPFTPAAGTMGVLGVGAIPDTAFAAGSASIANQTYNEVGGVTVLATGTDYLGSSGVIVSSRSPIIGRFIPDHFALSVDQGCPVDGFTYSGQPFASTPMTNVTVTALNAADNITKNYFGNFAKTLTFATTATSGALSNNTGAASEFASGVAPYTDLPTFTFTTKESNPETIALSVSDTDGVSSTTPVNADIVAGRVALRDVAGSELLPLIMPVAVQYFDNGWQTHTADQMCTTPTASAFSVTADTAGTSISSLTDTGNGTWDLQLAAPGVGNTGYADVTASGIATWLQDDWDDDGAVDDNPQARASFGLYQGNEKQIYIREAY